MKVMRDSGRRMSVSCRRVGAGIRGLKCIARLYVSILTIDSWCVGLEYDAP
jgi:hypothetical protein